jgi:DegV family protein with EDD domain
MNVAIVTDSTADILDASATALQVDVVPLFINFGDVRYRDTIDLSRADFYRKLRTEKVLPTTSQPTSAAFEDAFRPHAEAGRPVVCITIAGALSGTINAAQAAAAQFPGAAIAIVDSETVAAGLALQVTRAAELAAKGKDVDEILASLAHDRQTQSGYATLPDLSHAVRTGRVSRAQAFIGSLVKIVPVLRFDRGKVVEEARVRTFGRAQDAMIEAAVKHLGDKSVGSRIGVVHADAAPLANTIAAALRRSLAAEPASIVIYEVGPVIATHTGPGAVGVFVAAD